LDALVAEKVMGFRCVVDKGNGNVSWIAYGVYGETHTPPMAWKKWNYKVPPYSTDIAAAWEVWEHGIPDNWRLTITKANGKYLALIIEVNREKGHRTVAQVEADTAAEAMVKCRLLAVMDR